MRLVALGALAAAALGCSSILGLQEPQIDDSVGDGGGCDGGCAGTPELVTDNATLLAPYDMVVADDGYLYFTNGNSNTGVKSVARIDKTVSAGQPEILADWTQHEGYPNQIAVAGGNFFFAVDSNIGTPYWGGGIVACPVTGCPTPITFAKGNLSAYAVTTDGTNVFYGDDYTDGNIEVYELHKADTSTALGGASLLVSDANGDSIDYLDVDSSGTVYAAHASGIYSCPASGCNSTPTQLLPLPLEADKLRVVGDRVYFTSAPYQAAASVQWVPTTGGQPTPITTNVNYPVSVVADDTYVYFTDAGNLQNPSDGKVVRCPRDGCGAGDANAVVLSTGAAAGKNPRALAMDATYLYWGTFQGQVWRLKK